MGDFHLIYAIIGGVGLSALAIALWLIPGLPEAARERARSVGEVLRRTAQGLKETVRSRAILLTAGMEGVQNMTMGALHAFLPLYVVERAGLNVALAGLLWAVLTGTSVVAKPLMGRISDRYGRRGPIIAGMLLCALPFALIPLFTSFWALAALAVAFGLGKGSSPPPPGRWWRTSPSGSRWARPWAPSGPSPTPARP